MKTIFKVAIFIAAILVLWFSIRFFSGSEDTWICSNGQWVRHGNPSSLKPEESCGEDKKIYSDNEEISWAEAENLVSNCQAKKVWQTHARQVTLLLNNGVQLKTVESKLDDIVNVAENSQEKCGTIRIGTE